MTKTKIVLSFTLLLFALPLSAKPPHNINLSNSSGTVHFNVPSNLFAQDITPNFSIQFQQGGSNIAGGFFNESPFNLNCSTNLTCTISGSTVTMVATGGGSGSPCVVTSNSLQYNNAGAFGCVTQFTYSGSTLTGANGTLDLSGMTLVKLRFSAGLATTLNGDFGYDTTANRWHIWQNGADKFSIAASNVGASGQPCLSNADGSCTFSDPQVQGTQAPASTTIPNPVVSGGSDYGGTAAVRTQKIDASGNFYVALASAPTLTVNLPPQPFLNTTDFNDVLAASPTRGDLIVANSTPKWARFALGASGTLFESGATDPSWTLSLTGAYIFSGISSVTGSITTKKKPYNCMDATYGAKGDGATDDTAALNACFAAAKAATQPSEIILDPPNWFEVAGQLTSDGLIGASFVGPTHFSAPGTPGGRRVIRFTGTTSPFWSCSGCIDVTINGIYFDQLAATFTGTIIEYGPSVSTDMGFTNNTFNVQSTAAGGGVMLSLDRVDNALVYGNHFSASSVSSPWVYIRGAKDNTSLSTAVYIFRNTFNEGTNAVNGHVALQNLSGQTTVISNAFEIGAGTGLIPVNFTAGAWSTGIVNAHTYLGNFFGDANAANTQTYFTFPATCSGIDFGTNLLSPQSASNTVFNFGNSCNGIRIGPQTASTGGTVGTWITLGTGIQLDVEPSTFNGTISTFLSGTPALGCIITDNNNVLTVYGQSNKFGQADIVADSAAINTTETIIVKTPAFPASRLIAGSHIRFILTGTCTSTVANTSTFTIRWGTNGTTADGSVAALVSSVAATSGTNNGFRAVIDLTVRTAGASATSSAFLQLTSDGNVGIVAVPNDKFIAGSAFNTTTASGILSVSYKSAATTTTSTFKNATIEIVQN